jgi:RND family efflux transporter MFP subunit
MTPKDARTSDTWTGPEPQPTKPPGRKPVLLFFAALAVVVIAAVIAGLLPRLSRQKGLVAAAEEVAVRKPTVIVSEARFGATRDSIDLPGDLQPIIESPIFARADGYLKTRLVDIGDHVKTGQLMAEIETPELDQQIGQARATVAQSQSMLGQLQADIDLAHANLQMSRVTRDRWKNLFDRGVVSRQDLDEKQADFAVKEAQTKRAEASMTTARETIRASEANLRRLEELKGFAHVTAPFDGVVTARNVDIGTLISAGTAKEMFRVARIQPLRIFVNVPQSYVADMRNGQTAELRVQERPGTFPARVTNISNSLDTNSRSMLVILETSNAASQLFPGMYAQVRLAVSRAPVLRVPGDVVVMGRSGPRVATVGADRVVHFHVVTLGQDLGSEVEITSGLAAGDLVISNPTDAVQENAQVEVRRR